MAAVTAGSGAGGGPAGSPEATGGSTGGGGWRRPHGPLQRYYGPSTAEAAEAPPDPTDINGPHFDPEAFMTKVRSECPLGQLLAREAALGQEIRALDSDMQTLLYENYNKFISATGELLLLEPADGSGGKRGFGGRFTLKPADGSDGKWGFGDVHSGSTGKLP
ncbi:hypothetical protein DUI87_25426 [Hirundo rustica rustica]|uniref:Vacuolar protein sorting-associated protein 51 homolog n=1 Tax=Hirundo rustica rustica TaxID=333673 RepID=A0A3M0JAP7_HIRRU|nr:hypothetical protein DUI87_25426 [Hirundo rustica rustica]